MTKVQNPTVLKTILSGEFVIQILLGDQFANQHIGSMIFVAHIYNSELELVREFESYSIKKLNNQITQFVNN
jgi:secreted protein with Ig-like and vWFA domain